MSKVIVRGGSPGKIRCEVEGTDSFVEVDAGLGLYSGLHELQPWLQALADSVPETPAAVAEMLPPAKTPSLRPSKAPPKGDA